MINISTVDGDLINRCELFDEADLDAALARFDELSRPAPLLDNAATRIWARHADTFNRRDMEGFLALTAADVRYEDRRKGLRDIVEGPARRNAVRAMFGTVPSSWHMGVQPIAIRGSRLSLVRECYSDADDADRPITAELLHVIEVGDGDLIHGVVSFDPEDINAAFEELDSRYLAGEAAACAHTWSVITVGYASLNRRELPPTTPDWVNIDHRQGTAFAPGEMTAYIRAAWDLERDVSVYIEVVHRLSDRAAVVTYAAYATSQEGFDAEWREIHLLTVEGELVSRCELFDEADIDAALATFDELDRPATLVDNAATRAWARVVDVINCRDVDSFLALAGADARYEDRRKVLRDEGPARPEVMRALLEITTGWRLTTEPVAIRGSRLALTRDTYRDMAGATRPITLEHLTLNDNLGRTLVLFDPDDINGAFEELDARYLAGEAAPYAHTWSVITRAYAALNRCEQPATAVDWVNVDHRLRTTVEAGDLPAYLRAAWELTPALRIYVAAVHRLSDLGAVVTHAARGTSPEGLDAEWRMIELLTVDGDLIDRSELFDEADLDAALAEFHKLNRGRSD